MSEYIETLDDLIQALQKRRGEMGNCPVAIEDADTKWRMKILRLKPDEEVKEWLMIIPSGYADDDGFLSQKS